MPQAPLFQCLGQHAQQLGKQSGLPFFTVNTNQQQGHTFGERLHQAIAAFFDCGFQKIIVIGNDCPELQPTDINRVARLLQTKAAVFGPARDGGVYLLGLDKSIFTQKVGFTQINWQTESVLTELQRWAQGYDIHTLDKIYADLDSAKDLQAAFFSKILPVKMLAFLTALFLKSLLSCRHLISFSLSRFTHSFSFRGPPIVA